MNYEKDLPIDQSESVEGFLRGVNKDGVSVLIPKSNLNSQHGDIYLGTANVSTEPINESGYWICGENGTYVNFNNQLANKNDRFYWNKNTTNWDLVPNDQTLNILNQNAVKQDASFWVENAKASVVEVTAGGFYKYDGVNVIMAQKSLHNYYLAGAGGLSNAGQNNIGIGEAALLNNVGDYNIGIGRYSLYFNQSSNNVSEGYSSLMDLGSAQTAGAFVTGQSYTIQSSGNTNFTLIGAADNNVGTVFTATGAGTGTGTATPNGTDNNTAIGYNTGRGIIYGSGNTILGANVTGLDAGLTNNIIIADGLGNRRINVDGSGKVGIGKETPSEKLDVVGNGKFSGTLEVGGTSVFNDDMTLNGSLDLTGDINTIGELQGGVLTSTVADGGESPLNITSTTLVSNLNADMLGGHHWSDIKNQASISDNQIAVGTGTDIGGNSNLTWDGSILDVDGSINIADGGAYKYNGYDVIKSTSIYSWFFGGAGNYTMTGNPNTAIGYNALHSNNSGYSNIAIGMNSLYYNIAGNDNTAIGQQALNKNTGNNNTAIGGGTLHDNTTGENNVAIGNSSLRYSTTPSNNTAIGQMSMWNNLTGAYNTAIGKDTLKGNTTKNYNTAIGYSAGNVSGGNNNGDNSVYLGANTKAHADNETNQIVIGYNATGNGSNTVTLGNDDITETFLKGTINFDSLKAKAFRTISTVTDSGNEGEIAFDANYIYVCVGANSWKRITLTTW